MRSVAAMFLLVLLACAAPGHAATVVQSGFPPVLQPADLVLRGGTIVTLDPLQPEVQALAVRGGRVVALGSDADISRYVGDTTRVLDLHGAFVTPGFIEGHGHLLRTGESLMQVDVGMPTNWDGVVAAVRAAVAKATPGEWILGQGWQQAKWDRVPQPNVDGIPLPAQLDAASPRNPVVLFHASGHALYANAAALKAAGITDATPDPPGGSILRDREGHAVGMLRDTAMALVNTAYQQHLAGMPPAAREARRERALQLAVQNEVSKGITTFVDMGADFATIDWLKQQAAKGLPLRLYVNVRGESVAELDRRLANYRTIGYADHHFTVRGVGELHADGALGTRSAWFIDPYSDDPSTSGKNVTPMAEVEAIAKIAARDGFQLSVHAIGDRTNRETLDLFQRIYRADPAAHALRWRIEHAQHLSPADLPRFARLGVIASMQSIHACSDAPMVAARVGERRASEGAYAWHSLIESGAIVLEGTDTPVEDTNPIPNFYCAVTRAYDRGQKTFFPAQAKTPLQALRDYTWNNAYGIFAEHEIGSLSVGKLADLDVFSSDLLTVPADEILRARVLYTVIGGKVVYSRPGADRWRKGQVFEVMPEFNHAE